MLRYLLQNYVYVQRKTTDDNKERDDDYDSNYSFNNNGGSG